MTWKNLTSDLTELFSGQIVFDVWNFDGVRGKSIWTHYVQTGLSGRSPGQGRDLNNKLRINREWRVRNRESDLARKKAYRSAKKTTNSTGDRKSSNRL